MKVPTILGFLVLIAQALLGATPVEIRRLLDGAVQPRAVTDEAGTVHLVWLQGDAQAADVIYQKLPGGRTNGSVPIRVNSQRGSAIALGTIRGADLALGRQGIVHVVWNGSPSSQLKTTNGAPLFYTRMNAGASAFDPERNVIGRTAHLDGGASVAADRSGHVYLVWHAAPSWAQGEETKRRVYQAHSEDDGVTFSTEQPIAITQGVCGCCGLRALVGRDGVLQVLYRAAIGTTNRDLKLLSSRNLGASFSEVFSDPWTAGSCPMSSAVLTPCSKGVLAGWETKGRIQVAVIHPEAPMVPLAPAAAGDLPGKHATFAVNQRGETLCAWAEGTGWQRGGKVVVRFLDADGRGVGDSLRFSDLPVWSFPATFARDDGPFVVLY